MNRQAGPWILAIMVLVTLTAGCSNESAQASAAGQGSPSQLRICLQSAGGERVEQTLHLRASSRAWRINHRFGSVASRPRFRGTARIREITDGGVYVAFKVTVLEGREMSGGIDRAVFFAYDRPLRLAVYGSDIVLHGHWE